MTAYTFTHSPLMQTVMSETNIQIWELVRAADKMVKGDTSEEDVLEEPASQYEWREKEFGPTRKAE